jgi:hypothetical protein
MDLKNVVFGEVTADTFANLRDLEKLGPKLLTLRILSSELLKVPEHHDEHHHEDVAVCADPDKHDPLPGHQGLKHKHDH